MEANRRHFDPGTDCCARTLDQLEKPPVAFDPGQTSKTISVTVNGDRAGEPNETFLVNLGPATAGAVAGDSQGVGTIIDDEPRVSINDVSRNEGQFGTTQFVFTVTIAPSYDTQITLSYATADPQKPERTTAPSRAF
jgi:hypothetical protein